MDHRALLPKINAPTLVIAGRYDPATTLEAGEFIAQHMPNAKLAVLDHSKIKARAATEVDRSRTIGRPAGTHDRGTSLLRRKDRWPVENDAMVHGAMLRNSTPLAAIHLSVLCKA